MSAATPRNGRADLARIASDDLAERLRKSNELLRTAPTVGQLTAMEEQAREAGSWLVCIRDDHEARGESDARLDRAEILIRELRDALRTMRQGAERRGA